MPNGLLRVLRRSRSKYKAEEEEWNDDAAAANGGRKKIYSEHQEDEDDNDLGESNDLPDEGCNEDNKTEENEECHADETFEGGDDADPNPSKEELYDREDLPGCAVLRRGRSEPSTAAAGALRLRPRLSRAIRDKSPPGSLDLKYLHANSEWFPVSQSLLRPTLVLRKCILCGGEWWCAGRAGASARGPAAAEPEDCVSAGMWLIKCRCSTSGVHSEFHAAPRRVPTTLRRVPSCCCVNNPELFTKWRGRSVWNYHIVEERAGAGGAGWPDTFVTGPAAIRHLDIINSHEGMTRDLSPRARSQVTLSGHTSFRLLGVLLDPATHTLTLCTCCYVKKFSLERHIGISPRRYRNNTFSLNGYAKGSAPPGGTMLKAAEN
uniref:Uncharacterized protein n=1 Tax=Heliothis virescens TaxID=7102 RepID=A0A2A4JYC3_HELVI